MIPVNPLDLVVYSVIPISFSLSDVWTTFSLSGFGVLLLQILRQIVVKLSFNNHDCCKKLTVLIDMDVFDVDDFQTVSHDLVYQMVFHYFGPLQRISNALLRIRVIDLPHARANCFLWQIMCSSVGAQRVRSVLSASMFEAERLNATTVLFGANDISFNRLCIVKLSEHIEVLRRISRICLQFPNKLNILIKTWFTSHSQQIQRRRSKCSRQNTKN